MRFDLLKLETEETGVKRKRMGRNKERRIE